MGKLELRLEEQPAQLVQLMSSATGIQAPVWLEVTHVIFLYVYGPLAIYLSHLHPKFLPCPGRHHMTLFFATSLSLSSTTVHVSVCRLQRSPPCASQNIKCAWASGPVDSLFPMPLIVSSLMAHWLLISFLFWDKEFKFLAKARTPTTYLPQFLHDFSVYSKQSLPGKDTEAHITLRLWVPAVPTSFSVASCASVLLWDSAFSSINFI